MKIIILSIMVLGLGVSCKKVTGNLDVYQNLTIKNNGKELTLDPSNYNVKIKVTSSNKLKLKVDGKKFRFNIPSLPDANGNIYITSSEIDQGFDLKGKVETKLNESEVLYRSEACSVGLPACMTNGYGYKYCSGLKWKRDVRYRKVFNMKKWTFLFLDKEDNNEVLAELKVVKKSKKRIVVMSKSACR